MKKTGINSVRLPPPAKRHLAEKGSRVLLDPSVADAIRQVAKHDGLQPSELMERALVLYIDKFHPTWKRSDKNGAAKEEAKDDTEP